MIMTDNHATTERASPRNPTSVAVNCRPYGSSSSLRAADGVMHNYSLEGVCIETTCAFKPGTILIVRMLRYPSESIDGSASEWPRSMGLAEVRWHQTLDTDDGVRHAMGLRYLD